jgi:hypothetical protein
MADPTFAFPNVVLDAQQIVGQGCLGVTFWRTTGVSCLRDGLNLSELRMTEEAFILI